MPVAPDDSVSQLDRRFTGKRTLNGPRALPSSHLATPVVPEDDDNGSYGWVDPAGLGPEDDASTIVGPTGRAIPQGRAPPAAQQYYSTVEEEMDREEDVAAYRSSANLRSSSSAGLPLVRDAAPMAGGFDPSTSNVGSGVKPYQGYAAVAKGEDSDEEPPYGAYSRSGDADLERAMRDGTAGDRDGSAVGGIKSNFASAFAGSLSYVKSLRSTPTSMNKDQFDGPTDEYGYDGESTYPPQQLNKGYSSERAVDVSNMEPAPWHQRLLWDTTPNELRILEHKRGLGVQARPWACWILSVIMVAVLIYELVHMAQLTGSPIQTKPSVRFPESPCLSRQHHLPGLVLVQRDDRRVSSYFYARQHAQLPILQVPPERYLSTSGRGLPAASSISPMYAPRLRCRMNPTEPLFCTGDGYFLDLPRRLQYRQRVLDKRRRHL